MNYAFTVDWGDGTSGEVTSFDDEDKSHIYAEPGEYTVVISGLMEGFGFDNPWDKPNSNQLRRVPNLGNLGYVSLRNAFARYRNLTEFRGGVTNRVTDMSGMFSGATSANPDVSSWDVSQVTNMDSMFSGATSSQPRCFELGREPGHKYGLDVQRRHLSQPRCFELGREPGDGHGVYVLGVLGGNLDVSSWDVSQVTNMSWMFSGARSVNPDVSNWDVSQVTNMDSMFIGATSANPDVSNWDVSQVTNMDSMFRGATSANPDVSNWDVSQVESMFSMFRDAVSADPDE